MKNTKIEIKATLPEHRILSIDLLRGFAVLGILIMNIQNFSMIGAAYINPAAYGDLAGINRWVWIFSHIFADSKFMSLFSMLFGVGIIIFTERVLEKGRRAGPLHYRRNFWLLVFGMIHAYTIWSGDILVTYSLCAFLAFVFRKKKPRTLIIASVLFFIVPIVFLIGVGQMVADWPKDAYNQNMESWLPEQEKIDHELTAMQGNWMDQMEIRVESSIFMQTFLFFWQSFWRVMSMMLLGMALYKWSIITAQRSTQFYIKMVVISFVIGISIIGVGVIQNFQHQWLMDYSMFTGAVYNYVGSVGIALGYMALVMLLAKSVKANGFKQLMSSVGKMAFTNYILMSIVCSFIFYGHGLGLFGKVERFEQILIVIGVWIIILIISPLWLKKYQYGPLEWLWRVLTYWRIQPMKKVSKSAV
jgi:uncharacterized protein